MVIPIKIIQVIESHLYKAESKHPVLARSILPESVDYADIKELLETARKNCEESGSVFDVLHEEVYEIFDAILNKDIEDAREEIYDTIAVLLRLDKVLQFKQSQLDPDRLDIPLKPLRNDKGGNKISTER